MWECFLSIEPRSFHAELEKFFHKLPKARKYNCFERKKTVEVKLRRIGKKIRDRPTLLRMSFGKVFSVGKACHMSLRGSTHWQFHAGRSAISNCSYKYLEMVKLPISFFCQNALFCKAFVTLASSMHQRERRTPMKVMKYFVK